MSVRLMAAVFESETLGPTERLIMLALADHADDKGRCYPSIERLCQRTGLSQRAIQTNIRKLTESGYIVVQHGGGKGRANVYLVRANPATDAGYGNENPAPDAGYKPRTKCRVSGQTPHLLRSNPAADAPQPSGTIIGGGDTRARELPDYQNRTLRERLLAACGADPVSGLTGPNGRILGTQADMAEVDRWRSDLGLSDDQIAAMIADVMARKRDGPPSSLTYFRAAMQRLAAEMAQPALRPATVHPLPQRSLANGKPAFDRQIDQLAADLRAGRAELRPDGDDPFGYVPGYAGPPG